MADVLTNAGRATITGRLIQNSTNIPQYVGWGTGAGTAAATDTTLSTESSDESRATGTLSQITTSVTNDTYKIVATMTCLSSNKTITNAGVFDASSSGNLFLHSSFTGVSLTASSADSIQFTWTLQF